MISCDVTILGAGPYGLAAGAHLGRIKNLEMRIFGEPMDFWNSHMPEGMLLRSPWPASNISDPDTTLTIDAFSSAIGHQIPRPIPVERFVEYGLWFQRKAVPQMDHRKIRRVEKSANGFLVTVSDGEQFQTRRMVIAAGIGSFARRPKQFDGLPKELVTHVSDGSGIRQFKGKRVAVVGAGQSALESAALIQEAGGDVEVIVRQNRVHWLGWRARLQKLGPIGKMLYSPFDIGPAGVSRIVAVPDSVKYFPRSIQEGFRKRALRPAGARWLIDRCKDIRFSKSSEIASAKVAGSRLQLTLSDGTSREVDHVLLGTGYKVDVTNYPFLAPELSQIVETINGFPRLKPGFESSVPGLYFMGAPSAWNFGPLMFFVCGTEYAGSRLGRHFSTISSRNGHK